MFGGVRMSYEIKRSEDGLSVEMTFSTHDMEIIINEKLIEFYKENRTFKRPDALFIGLTELKQLEIKTPSYIKGNQFMGMELILIPEMSYMKLGYVEEYYMTSLILNECIPPIK